MVRLKPYSEAFFAIASEKNKIDEYEAQAKFILETYENSSEMKIMLEHPQVTMAQKRTVLEETFRDKVSFDFLSFFALILRKGREKSFSSILDGFLDLCLENKNTLKARVISAMPLSEVQRASIREKLVSISRKDILIKLEVDPTLIGGIKIIVDGKLIDLSVKNDIKDIKNLMKGAC